MCLYSVTVMVLYLAIHSSYFKVSRQSPHFKFSNFICSSLCDSSMTHKVLRNQVGSRFKYDMISRQYTHSSYWQVNSFKSYCELYLKDKTMDDGAPLKLAHEIVNDRWEVCLTISEKGFQQVSFVNSIATTKVRNYLSFSV